MTTVDETPNLAGRRILVAEDEYMSKLILVDLLEELGATVVGSVSSVDGILRAVDDHRPEIVTIDISLRGKRAYGAAASLQERGVPFVFITGYSGLPGCPSELRDAPRLRKPFTLEELATVLNAVLRQSGAS